MSGEDVCMFVALTVGLIATVVLGVHALRATGPWEKKVVDHRCRKPSGSRRHSTGSIWRCPRCGKRWIITRWRQDATVTHTWWDRLDES